MSAATDRWAALTHAERWALIERLHRDVAYATHDWAGLPPELQSELWAAMNETAAAPAEPEPDEADEPDDEPDAPTRRPAKKRKAR